MVRVAWAMALAAALLSSRPAGARVSAAQQQARDYFTQATAAFGLGHYDEAARLYESAFGVQPDASLLYDAAQANRLAGARARALQLYRNYLRLYPTGAFAPQARKQIAELEKPEGAAGVAAAKGDVGAPSPVAAATTTTRAAEPAAVQSRPAAAPSAAASAAQPAGPAAARSAGPRPPQALPSVRVSPVSAGADECAATTAQLELDAPVAGVAVTTQGLGHAFEGPAFDATRAWCGRGSLRVQAHFSLKEGRTASGIIPTQLGEVYLQLPSKVDLTGRTVTAHIFVDAPAGVAFGGQVLAANGKIWVDGSKINNVPSGRWITFSHTFAADNHLYTGGTAKVDQTDGIVVQLWALGAKNQRTWDGTVYVDDVGWK
jgi:tetratricopeptide (TPR) repeat protein